MPQGGRFFAPMSRFDPADPPDQNHACLHDPTC